MPQRFTLRGALDCFLDFRFETIRRKCAFQLQKVESRAHIVEGLLAALSSVDEVSLQQHILLSSHVIIRFLTKKTYHDLLAMYR